MRSPRRGDKMKSSDVRRRRSCRLSVGSGLVNMMLLRESEMMPWSLLIHCRIFINRKIEMEKNRKKACIVAAIHG